MPDIDIRPRPTADTLMPLLPSVRISMVTLSEQVEVFAVFPIAHFEVEAGDLGFLDPAKVFYKRFAESGAQRLVLSQRLEGLVQRAGQQVGLRLVGCVGRAGEVRPGGQAVEARVDLRGDVEVRVRRRLADAVLDARRGIAGAADDAQQRAAVLLAPDDAIGGERIGSVTLVAVDGRGAESASRPRVREQAGEPVLAGFR